MDAVLAAVERSDADARRVRLALRDAAARARPAPLPPPDPRAQAVLRRRASCTVLLLDDKTAPEGDLQLHSLAHGVIALEHVAHGVRRRAAAPAGDEAARAALPRRLSRLPHPHRRHRRVTRACAIARRPDGGRRRTDRRAAPPSWTRCSAAGCTAGTSLLITGPAGTGKSVLAHAVRVRRGRRAASACASTCSTSGSSTFRLRGEGLGMDLRDDDRRTAASACSRSSRPSSRRASSRTQVVRAVEERRRRA